LEPLRWCMLKQLSYTGPLKENSLILKYFEIWNRTSFLWGTGESE
jgi:hypothetical protein